jgi:hypothetical protein
MALAAVEGAGLNVRTNVHSMTDPDQAQQLRSAADSLRHEARGLAAEVLSVAETRAGLR